MADDETLRALESIQKKLKKIINFKKAHKQRSNYDTKSEQNEGSPSVNENSNSSNLCENVSSKISSPFTNKIQNNNEMQTYSEIANVSRSESNRIENLNDTNNTRDRLHGLERYILIQNNTKKSSLSNSTNKNVIGESKQFKIEANKPAKPSSIPDTQQKLNTSNLNSKQIKGEESISNESENDNETKSPNQFSTNINRISDSSSSGSIEYTSANSDQIFDTDVPRNSFQHIPNESPYNFPTAPPKFKDYKNLEECKRNLEVKLQRLYEIKRSYYEDCEDDIPYFNLHQFKNGVLIDEDLQEALVCDKCLPLNENELKAEIPVRRSSQTNDEPTLSLNRTRKSQMSVSTLIDKIIEKSENSTLENTLRNFQEKIELLAYKKNRTSSRCSNPSSTFNDELKNRSTDYLNILTRSRDSSCSRMDNSRFSEECSSFNEEPYRPINNLDIPERMRSMRNC